MKKNVKKYRLVWRNMIHGHECDLRCSTPFYEIEIDDFWYFGVHLDQWKHLRFEWSNHRLSEDINDLRITLEDFKWYNVSRS